MSLNEIYDGSEGHKSWQNYRITDLSIAGNFNIDTAGATPGDILQLNGSLDYTWVPYSATSTQPLEYAKATFGTGQVNTGGGNQLNVNAIGGSGVFTISGGRITINETASVLIFLNITSIPTQFSLPMFSLVVYDTDGVANSLCKMCPYLTTSGNQYTSVNCIAPAQLGPGYTISVLGALVGNSSQTCTVITTESNINILRLN